MDHVDGKSCFGTKDKVLDLAPLKLQDFAHEQCELPLKMDQDQEIWTWNKESHLSHVLRRKPPKPFPENIFKESAENLPSLV